MMFSGEELLKSYIWAIILRLSYLEKKEQKKLHYKRMFKSLFKANIMKIFKNVKKNRKCVGGRTSSGACKDLSLNKLFSWRKHTKEANHPSSLSNSEKLKLSQALNKAASLKTLICMRNHLKLQIFGKQGLFEFS